MADLSGGEGEYHAGQFLLCVVQLNAVQGEKDQHGVRTNSLIAVYERMIFDETEAQAGSLLLEGRVHFLPAKGLERGVHGGLQHPPVTKPVNAAGLGDQLAVEHEKLFLCQDGHFASSS